MLFYLLKQYNFNRATQTWFKMEQQALKTVVDFRIVTPFLTVTVR